MIRKDIILKGYFGQGYRIYIPFWKYLFIRMFTNIFIFKEINGKEIWLNK